MSNPLAEIPDITTLTDAARTIVFAARRKDQLQSLTIRTVRKQIEHDFALSAGSLDSDDLKVAIRKAVNQAVLDDLPQDLPTKVPKNKTAPEATSKAAGPKKGKSSTLDNKRVKKSKAILDSDEDGDTNDMPTIHITRRASAVTEESLTEPEKKKKRDTGEVKSESELSVLIDDEPLKKKRKARDTKTKATKDKKETASKKPETEEETIKRLKTFVSACGARKQWTKEFANLPEPKQQIKHLKTLLADLGMKGRYSMEKAKAIKLQRDLSRELADVQEFERKAGLSREERRKQDAKKKTVGELDTQSEESEESEESSGEGSGRTKRRKTTASRQIREYLAKQNDLEED